MGKKLVGYLLAGGSFLVWAMVPLPAFLDLPLETAAIAAGLLLVTSYAMFYLGVFLLGPEVWKKAKAFWRAIRRG